MISEWSRHSPVRRQRNELVILSVRRLVFVVVSAPMKSFAPLPKALVVRRSEALLLRTYLGRQNRRSRSSAPPPLRHFPQSESEMFAPRTSAPADCARSGPRTLVGSEASHAQAVSRCSNAAMPSWCVNLESFSRRCRSSTYQTAPSLPANSNISRMTVNHA